MADDTMHADERARTLKWLARRAVKLAEVATNPTLAGTQEAQDVLLAQFGYPVLLALARLTGDRLRNALWSWAAGAFRDYQGSCRFCGSDKPTRDAYMCAGCQREADAVGIEMDLAALLDMPAASDLAPGRTRTDAELDAIARDPESRD